MYELILAADEFPNFLHDTEEGILRHLSDPKSVVSIHQELVNHHWSAKNGWTHAKKKFYTRKIVFPLVSVNTDDFLAYVKEQLPALEEAAAEVKGNYIIVHRRIGNIAHIGMCIYDAITDRPVHWLD